MKERSENEAQPRKTYESFADSLNHAVIEEEGFWRGWETAMFAIPPLLKAVSFAAHKHRNQRRKDVSGTPYINHPLMVIRLMSEVGGLQYKDALIAGALHDTVEDTDTTPEEIEELFGEIVCSLVMEVTDDKLLDKGVRKQLQIVHAPHLSPNAKIIKLADKTANVTDIAHLPPIGWSVERRLEYLSWCQKVVAGCRGTNRALEMLFDQRVAEAKHSMHLH
jgi:guanosine-3',5'-bis(diphosphate) 3'-pyrophosphohydrolase